MGRHAAMNRWDTADIDRCIITFVRTTAGTATMAQLIIALEVRTAFASSDKREIEQSLQRLKKQGLLKYDMSARLWSYVPQSSARSVPR